jgi:hypothetical protein
MLPGLSGPVAELAATGRSLRVDTGLHNRSDLLAGEVSGMHLDTAIPVGARLLAKAVCQATLMLDVTASSRAGSLPQWIGVAANLEYDAASLWERACEQWPHRDASPNAIHVAAAEGCVRLRSSRQFGRHGLTER